MNQTAPLSIARSPLQAPSNVTFQEIQFRLEDLIVVSIWSSLLTYGFVTNLIILSGIMRSAHMRQSTSYWMIIGLSVCDVLMIIVSLAHLVPATLFHDAFVSVYEFRNIVALFIYNVFWYTGVILLAGMAVNRFVSIVYPVQYRRMFSKRNTLFILAFIAMLGVSASLPALFPCCYTVYDHHYWVTDFIEKSSNYFIVDLAVNTISLSIMIFCYAAILWKVRKSHLSTKRHRRHATNGSDRSPSSANSVTTPALNRSASQRRQPSRREMKLFVQFSVVSLVFLCTFLLWQWLIRIPDADKWIYFTTTTFFFINNAVNPTVYLVYNSGLRHEVKAMFCWWIKDKQPNHPSSDCQIQQDATTVAVSSKMDCERALLASEQNT